MPVSPSASIAVFILLSALSLPALAHSPLAGDGQERVTAWLTLALLGLLWTTYLLGARLVTPRRWQAGLFHATAMLCLLTLLGPLDDWAKNGTAAHMTQHMLLMSVIAPLWVLSRPLPQLVTASRMLTPVLWGPLLQAVRYPLLCACIHAAVIWFWHMPRFYMAAVENPWWHLLGHASFLVTAGLFWWSVFHGASRRVPWALLAVLFTLMHTGFLGAILSFARRPLYGEARDLADQQLAGLIMWVPGAIPYLLAAAWVGYRWWQRMQWRMA
jgi:putative membrane protein